MLEPKRITPESIPAALDKALRYRLLNEPAQAESICRDILLVDAENQDAAITLLLAITDSFDSKLASALDAANEVLGQIQGDYQQAYYAGVINERWADAQISHGVPSNLAVGWLREAMRCYEKAEQLSEPDDPDALLRWNTCARWLNQVGQAEPNVPNLTRDVQESFGDDVPPR